MADQTVLEEMVVRLVGDVEGYLRSLQLSQEATKKATDAISDQADKAKSAYGKVAEAIPPLVSKTQFYINAVKGGQDLLKGKFETTGDAMRKIGDIANVIPGPWGAAVSSVMNVLGGITDWFDQKFRKNVEAARGAFMAMADGAKTFGQAITDIQLDVMRETLGNMVGNMHLLSEAGRLRREGGGGAFGMEAGVLEALAGGNLQEQVRRMATTMRDRLNLFREFETSAEGRDVRERMAFLQAGSEAMGRAEGMPEHVMQRQAMRAMHDTRRTPEEAAASINRANEELQIRRRLRQLNREDNEENRRWAREQLQLNADFQQAQAMTLDNVRMIRAERTQQAVEEAGRKHVETMATAEDALERARAAAAGATQLELKDMERRQQGERELARRRAEGWSEQQIQAQRFLQLQERNAVHQTNLQLAQAANLNRVRTAAETYADTLRTLSNQMAEGSIPNQETFNRLLLQAQDAFRRADPGWQAFNRQAEAGARLAEQFADPADKMRMQVSELGSALVSGRLSVYSYDRALAGLAESQEKANNAMRGTPAAAFGSAEAYARITSFARELTGQTGRLARTSPDQLAAIARGALTTAGGPQIMTLTAEQQRLMAGGGLPGESPQMQATVSAFQTAAAAFQQFLNLPRLGVVQLDFSGV